nr:hypothetical protein [Gammaproteobacteria bacterium]
WPVIVALRENAALLALVKAAHLLGMALLVGSVSAFDLRVLGWNKAMVVSALAQHVLPLAVSALVLLIPSGLALFAIDATRLLSSDTFMVKMSLILVSGILAIAFHNGPYRQVSVWGQPDHAPPLSAKLAAGASLVVWIAVLVCAASIGRAQAG